VNTDEGGWKNRWANVCTDGGQVDGVTGRIGGGAVSDEASENIFSLLTDFAC
jgi:hypothetical protein